MATCSRCKEEIYFGPHPISGKNSPFSMDGEIHFKKCKPYEAEKRIKIPLDENKCRVCGAHGVHVFWSATQSGDKLKIGYACRHNNGQFIEQNDFNVSQINSTQEEYWQLLVDLGLDKYGDIKRKLLDSGYVKIDQKQINEFRSVDLRKEDDGCFYLFTGEDESLHVKKVVNNGAGNNIYGSDEIEIHLLEESTETVKVIKLGNIKGRLYLTQTHSYLDPDRQSNQ